MWIIRSSGRRRWYGFKNINTETGYLSVASAKRCRRRRWQCPSVSPHCMRSGNSSEASWRVRGWTTVAKWSDWDHDAGVGGTGSRTVAGHSHSWRRFSLMSDCRELMTQLYETLTGVAHVTHWTGRHVAPSFPQSVTTDGASVNLIPPRCQQTLKNCVCLRTPCSR